MVSGIGILHEQSLQLAFLPGRESTLQLFPGAQQIQPQAVAPYRPNWTGLRKSPISNIIYLTAVHCFGVEVCGSCIGECCGGYLLSFLLALQTVILHFKVQTRCDSKLFLRVENVTVTEVT